MSDYLEARIEALIPGPGQESAPVEPDASGFTERVSIGNLRPLLWRDWCGHLQTGEHDRLAVELDAELAAMTGSLTGRARQISWYLSAELLIDEDRSRLVPIDKGDDGAERAKVFQKSLVKLLSDLIGLRVESTAVDWDPDNEELLRCTRPRRSSGSGSTRSAGTTGGRTPTRRTASPRPGVTRAHCRPTRASGTLPATSQRDSQTEPGHLEATLPASGVARSAGGAAAPSNQSPSHITVGWLTARGWPPARRPIMTGPW